MKEKCPFCKSEIKYHTFVWPGYNEREDIGTQYRYGYYECDHCGATTEGLIMETMEFDLGKLINTIPGHNSNELLNLWVNKPF